jgi:hypothetical protein
VVSLRPNHRMKATQGGPWFRPGGKVLAHPPCALYPWIVSPLPSVPAGVYLKDGRIASVWKDSGFAWSSSASSWCSPGSTQVAERPTDLRQTTAVALCGPTVSRAAERMVGSRVRDLQVLVFTPGYPPAMFS